MNNHDTLYLAHFLFPETSGDKRVKEVLQKGVLADRICRLEFSEGDYVQDFCLLACKDKVHLSYLKDPDAFSYELKTPEEIKRACYYLMNCFQQTADMGQENPALLMSRRKYEELQKQAATCTLYFLSERLAAETGDVVHSPLLAKAMKNPTATSELRFCTRTKGGWSFERASYLEDIADSWLIRISSRVSEDWLIAAPFTRPQVCSALHKWLVRPSQVSTP
ncbi:hypothetical protein [Paenibacillus sp. P32E]|uniref:hypothetical protein n=1 Tax=Paenibacillus sp. P32E TaxID=1349434 RepID=UPI00093CD435|nr:hypothetical protein [Paenibacillus sp. P32E]OKP88978.1 hypothetical protein A3848_17040 [Paenibacillus sp. P32E]